jgi:asparagine synthase (glutamine-hydrolysing)
MCGFTGYALANGGRPDDARLAVMTRALAHRGPDDEGLLVRAPFALGFRRLSIIDLAGGHQPIWNAEGTVAVACNGEIYNFRELRRSLEARGAVFATGSDVEVILHLYLERGAALVDELVGMFAFCLLDWREPARPRVLLGRDRLGIKPLYYAETAEGLYWGSEPKALLASGAFARELRREALLEYLMRSFVGGAESAWAGIRRLPPAHTLSWDAAGGARLARYWDAPLDGPRDAATNDEVREWLERVVSEHLVSDVALGAFLSGGVDSNAVVDAMARVSGTPPVICSVGFAEKSHDELALARLAAQRLAAVHHTAVLEPDPTLALEVLPWFFDEPHGDPSDVPTYLVSQMAREHVTVALSGDGGDEVFAGYRRYVHDLAENRLRSAVGAPGRALAAAAGAVYPKLDWAPRVLRAKTFLSNVGADPAHAFWFSACQASRADALALLAGDVRAALADHDPFDAFEDHYRRPRIDCPLYRAQYSELHTVLPDQLLVKTDRASMAVSLETRVPLLDHRFVERFVHLPAHEKVRGARGKYRLRAALRGRVDDAVLDGKKRGFDTPLRPWLRGPLKRALRDSLETLPGDWFERAALLRLFDEHQSGRRDHASLLWSLLVLEQWRRRHDVRGLAA